MDHNDLPKIYDQLPKHQFGSQQNWSNGKYRFQLFPEGYIAINKELATGLHPRLTELLSNQPGDEVDIRLSVIATYCGIALDGTYTIEERDKLCFILAGRLEVLREIPPGTVLTS